METKKHFQQFLQTRKFLLVLPLLVLPFTTLLFWSLGGIKANNAQSQPVTARGGLNAALPDANVKDDKALNKLSYYEKTDSDSARIREQMNNDPYYAQHEREKSESSFIVNDTSQLSTQDQLRSLHKKNLINPSPYSTHSDADPNEAKVYKKLDELNAALNAASSQPVSKGSYKDPAADNKTSINRSDLDRLEQMMDLTKNDQSNDDPEMKQLSSMMEKIIDIQHPERLKENTRQTSQTNKGQVFAVTANSNDEQVSLLTNEKYKTSVQDSSGQGQKKSNQFYEVNSPQDNPYDATGLQNTIAAVIHEKQTLVDGAIAKLRLTNEVYINGILIPKGSFVFGIASLSGERLNIKISSIRYKNALFPVDLTVVDLDGIDGIYIPGAITRDVAKGSADRAIEGVGISSLDPSITQQAAGAGIEAAKTLLSKKVKLIKVTVKAGYQVLLRDEKQKMSP